MTAGRVRKPLDLHLLDALKSRFGERLSTAAVVREQHGRDEFHHGTHPPDAVVFARSTEDVAETVRLCAAHETPVIAYGTGTSVEGHISALEGGITIDLGRMNRVLRIDAADLDATVEAGVTRKALNSHLRDTGLFFPIDPGADASIGGMAATRASGTNAVRYGTMRENVLGLTVVLPDGSIVKTGGRARKSAAGYDLTRLFVGSEGTLGIMTEVTVRLYGLPEAISAAVCPFRSVADAVNTASAAIQCGIPVARMELMDDVVMQAVNAYAKRDYPAQPTLFLEFHGTEPGVEEQARLVGQIAAEYGGTSFRWTASAKEREALWQARHHAYYAILALRPGCRGWGTDVCVPISRMAECIEATKRDLAAAPFPCPVFGHVGDGNFHVFFILDLENERELALAAEYNGRLVRRALAMEGTCTGEAGIGCGKIDFLEEEHGSGVRLMKMVKRMLDPANIMNPGKVLAV
jgi:D-lactate dehydrogenase (cytochrome)